MRIGKKNPNNLLGKDITPSTGGDPVHVMRLNNLEYDVSDMYSSSSGTYDYTGIRFYADPMNILPNTDTSISWRMYGMLLERGGYQSMDLLGGSWDSLYSYGIELKGCIVFLSAMVNIWKI